MNTAQRLASNIKALCRERKVAIKKLIEDCNLSKSFIYDIEKRNCSPSIEILCDIADYFSVATDQLLGRTEYTLIAMPLDANSSPADGGRRGNGNGGDVMISVSEGDESVMNENAWNSLKGLCGMFVYFKTLDKYGSDLSDTLLSDLLGKDGKPNEVGLEVYSLFLSELGITKEILHEWSVANFSEPPTEKQLRGLFSLVKSIRINAKRIYNLPHNYYMNGNYDALETLINDYVFYINNEIKYDKSKKTG